MLPSMPPPSEEPELEETMRRRRIPAVAAAEPRGAITPGREAEEDAEEDAWFWEEPLAIVEERRKIREESVERRE